MAEAKTRPTAVSVRDFVAQVPNETRRRDAEVLLKLFRKVTGWKPVMWGPTIIGFGSYNYAYASGAKGSSCAVGFSPRGSALVLYSGLMAGDLEHAPLLAKLGKHRTGKGCLYINKLADVDMAQLERLLSVGVSNQKKRIAENGWVLKAS
ncbi:MAG: DUF1801 domain-containing protein [Alphaproteobacteria bacterium]|nr:DUF1801 domain-containing protein [Alphaproteobacteria bacterium]